MGGPPPLISFVHGYSQESCNAKKTVKNCHFTTGQLLVTSMGYFTIKPEEEKRTTDRFKRIASFTCMKIYTKYDMYR